MRQTLSFLQVKTMWSLFLDSAILSQYTHVTMTDRQTTHHLWHKPNIAIQLWRLATDGCDQSLRVFSSKLRCNLTLIASTQKNDIDKQMSAERKTVRMRVDQKMMNAKPTVTLITPQGCQATRCDQCLAHSSRRSKTAHRHGSSTCD